MPDTEKCRRIYEAAFGTCPEFDSLLFERYSEYCITSQSGGAMLFLLPARLEGLSVTARAYYLYAAATDPAMQGRGEMTRLLKTVISAADGPVFLKPATPSLEEFYKKRGFSALKASPVSGNLRLCGLFRELALLCKPETEEFTMMCSGISLPGNSTVRFADTLE